MEFGTFDQLPCAPSQSAASRFSDVLRQAQLADQLGYDTVWLAEYHFNPRFSIMPAPLVVAGAMAHATKRIRIGTAVSLVPLWHPARLAEEFATLDVLSNGRAVLGIGRGANPSFYEGFGVPLEESRARFTEGLETIIRCWTEPEVSSDGPFYRMGRVPVVPKPAQQPHPPVYIAANSPDTFPLAGSLGHNVLCTPLIVTHEGVAQGLRDYRDALKQHGHSLGTRRVNVNVIVYVHETPRQAYEGLEGTVNNYLGVLRGGRSRGSGRANTLTYDDVFRDYAVAGDPAQCVDKLHALRERFQNQEFMCWFNLGGMLSDHEVAASMRRFAEHVMPHFK